MAEALAAVGIVASIIQIVDFGSRVLKRLEEYQSKLGEIPEAFRHIKAELPVLLDALQQTKAAIDTESIRDETKNALLPAVEGCGVQIKALDDVIAEVLPASDDSWVRRRKKAFQSLRHDAKVKKITAVVRGYIQTLTYHAAASSSLLKGPLAVQTLPRPAPSSTVPFRRDPHFIDRKIFAEIKCKSQQSASRVALVGLGGVGKSQIAIEYAYRVRDESPTTWVFWVHAGTQARFEEGYRRIAETTRMEGWDNPKADVLRLVRNWLCDESNGRWVMIVDNVDDLGVFFPPLDRTQAIGSDKRGQAAESLSEFLPQSPNGSILITSRSRDVAYRLTGCHTHIREVKPMDEGDALALLQKKLSFDADEYNAIELLQTLDYMPLAITQAAAYIEQRTPRMTISRYLDEIRRSDHDRARLLRKDVGDSRRDGRVSNSIIATWQISFEHIRKELPTAARLLSLMSLFDRQGIPELLLHNRYQRGEDRDADFEEDIHMLVSYSLVEMNESGNEFEMHRLVQFSTKKWLELYDELDGWKGTYVTLMDDSYPVGVYENWTVCQALFPHAQAAIAYRPTDVKPLEAWASVLFKAAWYTSEMGNYQAAQEMDLSALEAREATLGAEHPKTLSSVNALGLVLGWQGKYIEAEAMHRRALEAEERVLGEEHPSTLTSMANLASTFWNQGRWKEAEELEVQVIKTRKRVLGEEHPSTLASMANLALTYSGQGRWKEAEELEVQGMKTRKRVLAEEHPSTLTSMANLASILRNQGRWKEAEELKVQVMKTRKRVLGEEHPDTLTSIANLASTYRDQGRWKEAEELEVQVMKTSARVLGEEHPDMLTSIANLASTYRGQGRWKEAEELEVQVMKTRKRVLGEEHPDTLTSIANLASIFSNQGRWKEAEELGVKVIEMKMRVLGEEHPDTLISIANLASTYTGQGQWKEAEELGVKVMETKKRVLGEDHPSTLTSIANLASIFSNRGRWKEAEEMEVQVMKMRKRVLGEEHPSTLASMANLALTHSGQGRWKEAEELEVQVMKTRKRVLGEEHPSTLTSMANLASTFWDIGRWGEAEELEVQVMKTKKRVLGEEHPDTLTSIANLALTYRDQGRQKEAEELGVQVMKTKKRVLGEEHPSTLTSMAILASTFWDQGRWGEAEELEVQVMKTRKRVLGEEHPDTLTSMANLAFGLKSQDHNKEAILLMEKCLQLRKQVLGPHHPHTISSLEALNMWRL